MTTTTPLAKPTQTAIPNPRDLNDESLLEAALGRNDQAWRELLRRYGPQIRKAIDCTIKRFKFFLPSDAGSEILSDFYLSLVDRDMAKLRAFQAARGRQLASWLKLLACKAAIDHLRKVRRIPKHVPIEAILRREDLDLDELADEDVRLALTYDPFRKGDETLAEKENADHPLNVWPGRRQRDCSDVGR